MCLKFNLSNCGKSADKPPTKYKAGTSCMQSGGRFKFYIANFRLRNKCFTKLPGHLEAQKVDAQMCTLEH